ncbi:ComE operon protein 1 [compost metagenome]
MNKIFLSSLLFALLANTSMALHAANPAPVPVENAASTQVMAATKINLNTADAKTLQAEMSGIGQSKAEAIVAYREANGPFASIDELLEVKGIGKTLLDKNRDLLSIN